MEKHQELSAARDCRSCQLLVGEDASSVAADENWSVLVDSSRPGWTWVIRRRHGGWMWDLSNTEQETLGRCLQRTSERLKNATGTESVYMIALGENSRHFHLLLIPRDAELGASIQASLRSVGHTRSDTRAAKALQVAIAHSGQGQQ